MNHYISDYDKKDHTLDNPGYIALSRLIAQQRAIDVRAGNIANANTPGFKAESVVFSDYLVQQSGVKTPKPAVAAADAARPARIDGIAGQALPVWGSSVT